MARSGSVGSLSSSGDVVGRVVQGLVVAGLLASGLAVALNVRGAAHRYTDRFTRWRTRDNRILFAFYAVFGAAALAAAVAGR